MESSLGPKADVSHQLIILLLDLWGLLRIALGISMWEAASTQVEVRSATSAKAILYTYCQILPVNKQPS